MHANEAGPDCASDPTPPTIATTGVYHFVITNTAASDRFVVTHGIHCAPFDVLGARTALSDPEACEGPGPYEEMILTPVAPGSSITIDWDGRGLAIYEQRFDCATVGWPGLGCGAVEQGALQPVTPGVHTITFLVADATPPCGGSANGGYGCMIQGGGLGPWFQTGVLCEPYQVGVMTTNVTADVMAPPMGDVTVPVSIP
jgi:hypothetical protein